MYSKLFIAGLSLGATLALTTTAHAEVAATRRGDERAKPYTQRSIVLPKMTLRLDAGQTEQGVNNSGLMLSPTADNWLGLGITGFENSDADGGFGVGAAYGITDDLEVGALVLPVGYRGGFGDMDAYIRYMFLDTGKFQMGVQGTLNIPTDSAFGFAAALPMNFLVSRGVRLELAVEAESYVGDDRPFRATADDFGFILDVPFAASFAIKEDGFVGPRVNVSIVDFEGFVMPIGAFGGYTVRTPRLTFDVSGRFDIEIWDVGGGDAFIGWVTTAGCNFYFGF